MLKDFLPQNANQWKLFTSHVIWAIVLLTVAPIIPLGLGDVFLVTMVFVYGEIMELKGKIAGSIFEWTKIKAMISSLDDKHILWQWAGPLAACLLWTIFF